MDDDSCSKFIGSLTKYLQSLCHSYVDFESGVELVGHIYLNVDTGKKIDYVLNESVCKNGANVVKFTSNSYHAQPVEKQKKETPKKTQPESSKNTPEKKKNDDDDVIIVGSEASRSRARQGQASGSRPPPQMNQMQNLRGQQRPMQQAPGVFRHPRGPQPRMSIPRHNVGGYRYPLPNQATVGRPRGPQPRSYAGAAYNPNAAGPAGRMDPMHINNPYSGLLVRPPLTQGRRASDPVDTDVTFMREEYVPTSSQHNARIGNQSGQNVTAGAGPGQVVGTRLPPPPQLQPQPQPQHQTTTAAGPSPMDMMNQRFGYPPGQPAPQYVHGQQQQQQQQFRGPRPPATLPSQGTPPMPSLITPGQLPGPGMPHQNVPYRLPAGQQNMGGIPPGQRVPNTGAPAVPPNGISQPQTMPGHGVPVSGAPPPPSFLQNEPQVSPSVSAAGGMPLPTTTHTIFDSNPPPTSVAAAVQPPGDGGGGGGNHMLTAHTAASSTPPITTVPMSSAPPFPTSAPQPGPGVAPASQLATSMEHVWGDKKPMLPLQTGMGQAMLGSAGPHPPSSQPTNTPPAPTSDSGAPSVHRSQASAGGSDSVGNIFDIFSQPHLQPQHPHPPHLSPQHVSGFLHDDGSGTGGVSNVPGHAGGETGNGETDFFSQLLDGHPATTNSDTSQPAGAYQTQNNITPSAGAPGSHLAAMSPLHGSVPSSESEIKIDPGQIGVAIATAVIQEATAGAANEMQESFLTPHGVSGQPQSSQHQAAEAYRKRSGSTSSTSLDAPSPLAAHQAGTEGHLADAVKVEAGSQQQTSDYESGWESGSAEKMSSPAHHSLRSLTIPLVPVDSTVSKNSDSGTQEAADEQDEWARDAAGAASEEESSVSDPEPDQDDNDPSYTPGRSFAGEKGATKRPRGRPPGKGKKRKTDKPETAEESGQKEETSLDMDVTAEVQQAPGFSPSIETDNAESGDSYYKPGTFVLVNTSKELDRVSRTRPIHTPAEVICTPEGKEEGLWVHLLVAAGNGLWRLPNVEQLVEHSVDPADIIKRLNNASVKIIGSKVFYKFDDL